MWHFCLDNVGKALTVTLACDPAGRHRKRLPPLSPAPLILWSFSHKAALRVHLHVISPGDKTRRPARPLLPFMHLLCPLPRIMLSCQNSAWIVHFWLFNCSSNDTFSKIIPPTSLFKTDSLSFLSPCPISMTSLILFPIS